MYLYFTNYLWYIIFYCLMFYENYNQKLLREFKVMSRISYVHLIRYLFLVANKQIGQNDRYEHHLTGIISHLTLFGVFNFTRSLQMKFQKAFSLQFIIIIIYILRVIKYCHEFEHVLCLIHVLGCDVCEACIPIVKAVVRFRTDSWALRICLCYSHV